MFMLTHTYFLQKVLGPAGLKETEPDVFVYNVAPDLLAIHPQITSARTHNLHRFLQVPVEYPNATFVIYHLLIDDLSHYGHICSDYQEEFNVNSRGYSYLKGNHLIKTIQDLHEITGKDISYQDAVYHSHLIIEMIYDLVIANHIDHFKTVDILVDAIQYTEQNKMDEFVGTLHWLYGLEEKEIRDVMKNAVFFITRESMKQIMNMEGRMNLYKDKFGLRSNKQLDDGLKDLFKRAMDLINDDELFFKETVQIIKDCHVLPFIR